MDSNNKVLALKYRPQTFDELVGQHEIAQSIFNSIKNNKTPNAYMFLGIRGSGKTSTARIVAKALNCENGVENLCTKNYCSSCKSIIEGNNIDILEIDAASKTSVDDVRELIEFSRYKPSSAKYKIFICDEVHMFSKSAFAALLKTLEEPPPYLKFIFASTDVKKIPVTIISRCQRYDLSRIKSEELFDYLIKIKNLEKAKISDDALKLIVKLSEGSVRDSLSLLDRVMLVENDSKEIDLKIAQKIFGYFEKSIIINLIENIIDGDEVKTLRLYKDIYNSGVEPKVFLNEFLETIYYVKNISFINLDGSNFDLNDKEFEKIKSLSSNLDNKDILLLWQFTLDNLEKIDFVKNQYQFIEMFLIRSLYLKKITKKNTNLFVTESNQDIKIDKTILANQTQPQKEVVDQLKNIKQEKNIQVNPKIKNKNTGLKIESLKDLAELCEQNRELKIKYDIENNLRLVSIKDQKIEISFNSTLDKSFVKELSNKLLEWTGKRWIIAFSKENGSQTLKEQSQNLKINLFKKESESGFSKEIKNIFPDAELLKVEEDENI
ncbi:DNA polymerase III subunit gamma/tau [Candidatus Pelagibacter sp.]|nr:DNA polymerase III subunit gamma/tau [Candidatus Pelagibacter sp.]|tara:strand:+ start:336 stop:1985 length:1650 start_codon:yes stop_codon:yes gene_type:complete